MCSFRRTAHLNDQRHSTFVPILPCYMSQLKLQNVSHLIWLSLHACLPKREINKLFCGVGEHGKCPHNCLMLSRDAISNIKVCTVKLVFCNLIIIENLEYGYFCIRTLALSCIFIIKTMLTMLYFGNPVWLWFTTGGSQNGLAIIQNII